MFLAWHPSENMCHDTRRSYAGSESSVDEYVNFYDSASISICEDLNFLNGGWTAAMNIFLIRFILVNLNKDKEVETKDSVFHLSEIS